MRAKSALASKFRPSSGQPTLRKEALDGRRRAKGAHVDGDELLFDEAQVFVVHRRKNDIAVALQELLVLGEQLQQTLLAEAVQEADEGARKRERQRQHFEFEAHGVDFLETLRLLLGLRALVQRVVQQRSRLEDWR